MYKITLIKSSRKLQIFSKSPKVMYWSIIPITSHLFQWAVGAKIRKRLDRLPFQVCPRLFIISHYAKNVKPEFMLFFARISIGYPQLPSKNRLDKPAKIAYNKSKESTPVDGLLPWIKLWNNRSSLQLGAVISVYYRYYGKYRASML